MKLTPQSKLDESVVLKARQLYMDFIPVSDIALKLNVPRTTIQNYVNKEWRAERIIFSNELLSEIADNKKAMLTKVAGKSVDLIIKALNDLSKKESLSAFEANVLANLFEKLDRILKLDAGNPTEILANTKPATVVEIQNRLKMDPFLLEDAEIIEEDESEDDTILNVNTVRDEYSRKN